jgi:hypothetical protein
MMAPGDLPTYRCTAAAATADRAGHAVCAAHSRTLHRLAFYDDADGKTVL